jgi:hypothetical protein
VTTTVPADPEERAKRATQEFAELHAILDRWRGRLAERRRDAIAEDHPDWAEFLDEHPELDELWGADGA